MAAAFAFSPLLISQSPSRSSLPPLLSGIASVDETGGVPRPSLTEIYGSAGCGRTSLAWSLICASTRRGECCALVDACETFDPRLAEEYGVDLARILWVRCRGEIDSALKATDLLANAGGFCLVILDLSGTDARLTRRIPAALWFRLRRGAEQSGCALVLTAEQPLTGSCAQLQISVRQDEVLQSTNRLNGVAAAVNFYKGRHGARAAFRAVR